MQFRNLSQWTPVLLIVIAACTFNWVYPYVDVLGSKSWASFVDSEIPDSNISYSAAGWPWTYYAKMEYEDAPAITIWDFKKLGFDLLAWGVLLVLGCSYCYNNSKKIKYYFDKTHNFRKKGWSSISLFDFFLVVTFIGCGLGYWQWIRMESQRSESLAAEVVHSGGAVTMWATIPAPLTVIPEMYLEPLKRITMVSWDNPSRSLLRSILKEPHLYSLRLGGDSYDLEDLHGIRHLVKLGDLRIAGRTLSNETVLAIGKLKGLHSLSLMRTNVTAKGLAALGEMPRLRYLNVIHTDVKLSEIQSGDPWTKSVQVAFLPRPPRGVPDSLQIDNWPQLRKLHLFEFDERLNVEPVSISIANANKLELITLDSLQLFDLQLAGLPSLKKIGLREISVRERIKRNESIPNGLWIRNLSLTNIPGLEEIGMYACNLESLQVTQCDKLEVKTNYLAQSAEIVEDLQIRGANPSQLDDRGRVTKLSNRVTTKILNAIGSSHGLKNIDLEGLSLTDADLTPLAMLTSAQNLNLSSTGIRAEQLAPLKPLSNLTSITLKGTLVQGRDLKKIFEWFPQLKQIHLDAESIGRVRIEQQPMIESIANGFFQHTDALRLVNLPHLKDSLNLSKDLTYLYLEDLPSITSLFTTAPWPAQATVAGLRDLNAFSGGGKRFDDKTFDILLPCEKITTITIAYSSVTAEKFKQLNRFKMLDSLVLTGSKVNDESVATWSNLQLLELLYLTETQVTSKSLPWICSLKPLKYLGVDYEVLAEATKDQWASLAMLQGLTVHGPEIPASFFDHFREMKHLHEISFEGATLTKDSLIGLSKALPPNIRVIDVRFCDIDPEGLTELVKTLPPMVGFATYGANISPELYFKLMESGRILDEDSSILIQHAGQNFVSTRMRNSIEPTNEIDRYGGAGYAVKPRMFRTDEKSGRPR